MTNTLTHNQRMQAIMAIAGRRTEQASHCDLEAFYYESMVDALDDLDTYSLLAEAGFTLEDL